MRYPGGKGRSYQHVINLMPPHDLYIESHLGGGSVLRHKRPAQRSIAIDRDPRVLNLWRRRYPNLADYHLTDSVEFLSGFSFHGGEVVYADPPYLTSTRRRSRVYRFDYTQEDHKRLLDLLRSLPCPVIISAYPSRFYDRALAGWRTREFSAKTHRGMRTEVLWYNFNPPRELHDSRFIGDNYRQREVVRRRLARLKERLQRLPAIERNAIRRWLEDSGGAT